MKCRVDKLNDFAFFVDDNEPATCTLKVRRIEISIQFNSIQFNSIQYAKSILYDDSAGPG